MGEEVWRGRNGNGQEGRQRINGINLGQAPDPLLRGKPRGINFDVLSAEGGLKVIF